MKKKTLTVLAVIFAALLGVGLLGRALGASVKSSLRGALELGQGSGESAPNSDYIAVIYVNGSISSTADSLTSYHHNATLRYIRTLADDKNNVGIFLDLDTPGGGVYESDELYLALQDYKEATGRPVWAYMNSMCASGGYYVSMAADFIAANRNTTTGSVGVVMQHSDLSRLYEKLGISTDYITSGANKSMGAADRSLTEEQRAIYQSVVDEAYGQFVDLICAGRGLAREDVLAFADGRIYTAAQALGLGMIDEIGRHDDMLWEMCSEYRAEPYAAQLVDYTLWDLLFASAKELLPKSEAQAAADLMDRFEAGEPLYLALS